MREAGELDVQVRAGASSARCRSKGPPRPPSSSGGACLSRQRLTRKRLLGLDRSGPPPPQTLRKQPLNPWTIPNAIGFVRLALLPLALVLALSSGDGRDPIAWTLFAVVAWGDYADGLAAGSRANTAGSAPCSTRSSTGCS